MGRLGLILILMGIIAGFFVGGQVQANVWAAALVTVPFLLGLWAWSRA